MSKFFTPEELAILEGRKPLPIVRTPGQRYALIFGLGQIASGFITEGNPKTLTGLVGAWKRPKKGTSDV